MFLNDLGMRLRHLRPAPSAILIYLYHTKLPSILPTKNISSLHSCTLAIESTRVHTRVERLVSEHRPGTFVCIVLRYSRNFPVSGSLINRTTLTTLVCRLLLYTVRIYIYIYIIQNFVARVYHILDLHTY